MLTVILVKESKDYFYNDSYLCCRPNMVIHVCDESKNCELLLLLCFSFSSCYQNYKTLKLISRVHDIDFVH